MHNFNPSTIAEAVRSLSSELKPDWLTEQVLGQLGLYKETLSWGKKREKKNEKGRRMKADEILIRKNKGKKSKRF